MKLKLRQLIFLGYFLGIFILSRLSDFSFSWGFLSHSLRELIPWFLGAFLGAYIIKLEQLVYVYYVAPQQPLSLQVKDLINQNQPQQAWILLKQKVTEQKLAFRSLVFQAIWVVLAFFTLTSTSVLLGKTLVMAIGLHFLLDEWEAVLRGENISWVFWQVKREVGVGEQRKFIYIMTGIFGILSLLLI